MSSPCRNPEQWAVVARLRPIALAAMLAVAANNAGAQQDTAPSAGRGPNEVSVTSLFPNGVTPLRPPDAIGGRFDGNKLAIADGQLLFNQMNCTGCHFNGGGGMGPALMSGHWRYGGRIEQIYASIAQGPSERHAILAVCLGTHADLGPRGICEVAVRARSL